MEKGKGKLTEKANTLYLHQDYYLCITCAYYQGAFFLW